MHDHAVGVLGLDDRSDMLEINRLEVQNIARVVVSADSFWVAVIHYRSYPHIAQSVAGVHAAVVKLYALPDAVRTAADDEDLFIIF